MKLITASTIPHFPRSHYPSSFFTLRSARASFSRASIIYGLLQQAVVVQDLGRCVRLLDELGNGTWSRGEGGEEGDEGHPPADHKDVVDLLVRSFGKARF